MAAKIARIVYAVFNCSSTIGMEYFSAASTMVSSLSGSLNILEDCGVIVESEFGLYTSP
jgi:hypothetical protein